ncbi:MAG: hypothetical protein IIB56_01245 [Planctomycetes bacterium]|nr:hypothetical protein [Planctomycetota bacterium]
MSEQERDKAGLHKEISSIFKGVSIPQTDGGQKPSDTPAPEHTNYTESKPPTPEPQKSEAPKPYQATQSLHKAAPERTGYTEPKPPAPEPQKSEVPKAYQTTQSLPKAAPERTGYTEPKPPTPEPQKSEVPKAYQTTQSLPKAAPERTGYTEPKPPTPEPQKPKAPKPYQAMQSLPKSTGARQPKADINDIKKNVSQKRTTVKISSQTSWQQITNKLFAPKPGASTTKQKAMVVTMPLLFIVLIFMLLKGGVFGTSVRNTEASAEDNASSVATAGSNTKIDWEIPAPYPTTLRDPMRLGPAATAQTGTDIRTFVKLILKGILYTEDSQSAVIGNQIVHEGEEIRGVTIVKISKDSVEFEMNGKRWTQKVR